MSNRILERWGEVLSACSGAAIYLPCGKVSRTWREIDDEAREFEGILSRSKGAVALQTGNNVSFPALVIACQRAERPAVLFDSGFGGAPRERIEKNLGVTLRVENVGGEIRFEEYGNGDIAHASSSREICLFKLTSGTTSLPKPIGFTADQLLADCDQVCMTMGIRLDDLNYGIVSLTHSYGFSNLLTPLVCRGVRLVVASDPLPRALESGLFVTGATVLAAVPAMFRGLLSAQRLPETLRLCISAGALLEPALTKEFLERFGRKIHTFYGASECGGICYDGSGEVHELPGFVGQPLQGVRLELVDREEGGRIVVHSRAVGEGVGDPDCGFQPADLLVRDSMGFRIVGRESDMINVAGRKVNPMEIEEVLAQWPGLDEVVVCGVEETSRGQEICALIASSVEVDISSVRQHCSSQLVSWKVPRRFHVVPEIPRNARGKISRVEIAKAFFQGGGSGSHEGREDFDRLRPGK